MPLQWLGQLRIPPKPKKKPSALTRALETPVKAYAGPTSTLGGEKSPLGIYPELAKGYFKPEGGLMGALTGGVPDWQADAWAKRKEMVEANQAKLDAEADALYGAVQNLGKPDQDYVLSKVAGKGKDTGALAAALGAKPGAISPAAIRTDPLMKTMIDKNYIKKTATGYAWMLPEKEKEVANVSKWTDESGWLNQTTTFKDGTSKTEIIGREAPEAAKAPSVTEQVAVAKLGIEEETHNERFRTEAIKNQGDMPREGDVITVPGLLGDKKITITADNVKEHQNNYWKGVNAYIVNAQRTIDNVKAKYESRPDIIIGMKRKLGWPENECTGEWNWKFEEELVGMGVE